MIFLKTLVKLRRVQVTGAAASGRIVKGSRFNHQSLLRHVNSDLGRPLLSLQVRFILIPLA